MDSVTTESLPVLQAFQDFLEQERKHARRQVAAVTAFFLILFLIVAGAGAFFGYVYFGQLNTQIASLRGELDRTSNAMKEETSEMLTGLTRKTEALSTRMIDGDELIRKATTQISSTVSNSLSVNLAEIDEIRNALRALREENRNLRHDLARIKAAPQPVVTSGIDTTMASIATSTPMPRPSGIDTGTDKTIKPLKGDELMAPLEMAILAPGSSRTLKWRIPIAE